MSPNVLLVLLVGGSALAIVAILRWAPRYQAPCPACGRRSRLLVRTCDCGQSLVPVRTPEDKQRIAALVGEKHVEGLLKWLDGAAIHQPLSSTAWFCLGSAYQAILMRRADLMRDLVNELGELPRESRATLIQAGEGSIIIREELERYSR